MRTLSFSDIHLDAVTAGKPRRAEVLEFLQNVFNVLSQQNIDLLIFAGDAHDPGGLLDPLYTSDLIRYMFAFLRAVSCPVVVAVAGNHDVVDTSEMFLGSPVTALTPLRAAVGACLTNEWAARMHIFDRPFTRRINANYAVLGLPYVSRVHLPSLERWEAHAFEQADEYVARGVKVIVVGHKIVPGARMGSESREMAKGQDQIFPFDRVMRLNPALVINGHYHAHQEFNHESFTIRVPGSPVRFTFGEIDDTAKGVFLAVLP